MTLNRLAWLAAVAISVMVANVLISVLYMVVYSYVIDPGHEEQYYHEHIKVAAPYCSIVAGIPLMFLAGWWVGGWWENEVAVQSALGLWMIYVVVDFAILLGAGLSVRIAMLFAISFVTKLAAVYFGAKFATRGV